MRVAPVRPGLIEGLNGEKRVKKNKYLIILAVLTIFVGVGLVVLLGFEKVDGCVQRLEELNIDAPRLSSLATLGEISYTRYTSPNKMNIFVRGELLEGSFELWLEKVMDYDVTVYEGGTSGMIEKISKDYKTPAVDLFGVQERDITLSHVVSRTESTVWSMLYHEPTNRFVLIAWSPATGR